MATKYRVPGDFRPSLDMMMSALLALVLIGGLVGALYVYQAAHSFVLDSQLPIFPAMASAPEALPGYSDAPDPVSASNDVAPVPETSPPDQGVARPDVESESANEGQVPAGNADAEEPSVSIDDESDRPPPAATERLTVLVMGIDRREEEDGPWRTDSMILISIDPASDSIGMLSVPRDLLITIPDYGYDEHRDRINTAYVYGELYDYPGGGAALAQRAFRRNFGIEVDRYIVMDFNGFERII
ncbi:MAG: LCP family protein, partial [Ardenticatenaceae bacterium]